MITHSDYNILVVDDDPGICELLARWVRKENFQCQAAQSADEALNLLKKGAFELMLTDINMPVITGLELQKLVRKRYPDLAVILVTAVEDRDIALHALENGAFGYIIKPFHRLEVILNVTNALRLRKLEVNYKRHIEELEDQLEQRTRLLKKAQADLKLKELMRISAARKQ